MAQSNHQEDAPAFCRWIGGQDMGGDASETLGGSGGAPAPRVSKWSVCTDAAQLRRLGKSLEEVGELVEAIAEHLLQVRAGATDGASRAALCSEIADVLAQCQVTRDAMQLAEVSNGAVDDRACRDGGEGGALLALVSELGRLGHVAARVIIQGVDEIDPGTGVTNRIRLRTAVARTERAARWAVFACGLDVGAIEARAAHKVELMHEWEALYVTGPSGVAQPHAGGKAAERADGLVKRSAAKSALPARKG